MKVSVVLLLAVFAQYIACATFSSTDQEIFRINHELKEDLGESIDFYEWLKLPKKAKSSYDEITRAYKKLSVRLHPDKFYQKNKNKYSGKKLKELAKLNNQRYERLSVIGEILRSDRKQRYDFYLSNGFPKWNGQGFFYAHFKPGFIAAILIVFVIVCILQYILLGIQRKQEKKRIDALKEQIKKAAWPNGYPPADFSDRKITAPNLDKDFIIKGDGSIYLVEKDDKGTQTGLHLVDSNDVRDVCYKDSFAFKLSAWSWNSTIGRLSTSLHINTEIPVETKVANGVISNEDSSMKSTSSRKKKAAGERKELPNGKVVYARKRK